MKALPGDVFKIHSSKGRVVVVQAISGSARFCRRVGGHFIVETIDRQNNILLVGHLELNYGVVEFYSCLKGTHFVTLNPEGNDNQ